MSARDIAVKAKAEIAAITNLRPETVSKVLKTDKGWLVNVDMIERRAIPDSQDVLATYEVHLDAAGSVVDYQRIRRYLRGELVDSA